MWKLTAVFAVKPAVKYSLQTRLVGMTHNPRLYKTTDNYNNSYSHLLRFCFTSLCDWLEKLRHFLNQSEVKPKPLVTCSPAFSRALRRLQVFATSSDWFITLFAPVLIGQNDLYYNPLRFWFDDTQLKTAPSFGVASQTLLWSRHNDLLWRNLRKLSSIVAVHFLYVFGSNKQKNQQFKFRLPAPCSQNCLEETNREKKALNWLKFIPKTMKKKQVLLDCL